MNNIFSFVIIVSEMQDGNILKAKKATHCCCLSPVATLRANTVSNFNCYRGIYMNEILLDWTEQYATEMTRESMNFFFTQRDNWSDLS